MHTEKKKQEQIFFFLNIQTAGRKKLKKLHKENKR